MMERSYDHTLRRARVSCGLWVDPGLWARWKLVALMEGKKFGAFVEEGVNFYIHHLEEVRGEGYPEVDWNE